MLAKDVHSVRCCRKPFRNGDVRITTAGDGHPHTCTYIHMDSYVYLYRLTVRATSSQKRRGHARDPTSMCVCVCAYMWMNTSARINRTGFHQLVTVTPTGSHQRVMVTPYLQPKRRATPRSRVRIDLFCYVFSFLRGNFIEQTIGES